MLFIVSSRNLKEEITANLVIKWWKHFQIMKADNQENWRIGQFWIEELMGKRVEAMRERGSPKRMWATKIILKVRKLTLCFNFSVIIKITYNVQDINYSCSHIIDAQ